MAARSCFLLLAALFVLLPRLRADDAWLIVPGKGIGKISLGMPQSEVCKLLGTPNMQNDFEMTNRHASYLKGGNGNVPVAAGVTQSDWTTLRPAFPAEEDGSGAEAFMCDFVTVYVRDAKVVQIEVRSPRFHLAGGLSTTRSSTDWQKQFPDTVQTLCRYDHPSAGGYPGTKHFVDFEDAVPAGLAWRYGWFGDAAPDGDPADPIETVIIHAPGAKLLVDPDGGSRFVWKDFPLRRAGD